MREVQERIDSAEFAEWVAFYRMEPTGGAADDHRIGTLCSTVAAIFGSKLGPEDFFPRLRGPGQHEDPRHQNRDLEAMVAMQIAVGLAARGKG